MQNSRGIKADGRAWIVWTLLAGLLLICAPARANTKTGAQQDTLRRAKTLFEKAEVHFSVQEFSKALLLYKESYKAHPLPELLYNMGQCCRFMGQCKKARLYYEQFLLKRPKSKQRGAIKKLIERCEAEAGASRPTGGQASPAAGGQAEEPPAPPPGGADRPDETSAGVSRAWFWSGVGVTAALLATAAGTGIAALVMNDEYLDPDTSVDRATDIRETGPALEKTFWATLGIGVAAAAGTAVLFWLSRAGSQEDSDAPAPSQAAITFSAGPLQGGGTVQLGGRF